MKSNYTERPDLLPDVLEKLEKQPYVVELNNLTISVDKNVFPPDLGRASQNLVLFSRNYNLDLVLELGCGTGFIGLSIKLSGAGEVWMGDIHKPAVACAAKNIKLNPQVGKVNLVESDLFENIPHKKFTLIVFAQPFAPANGHSICGCGDDGGYEIVNRFLRAAPQYMAEDCAILMPFSDRAAEINNPGIIAEALGYTVKVVFEKYYNYQTNYIYEIRLP